MDELEVCDAPSVMVETGIATVGSTGLVVGNSAGLVSTGSTVLAVGSVLVVCEEPYISLLAGKGTASVGCTGLAGCAVAGKQIAVHQ